jgi:hypothetical protein
MVAFMKTSLHPRLFLHAAPFFAYFWAIGVHAMLVKFQRGTSDRKIISSGKMT